MDSQPTANIYVDGFNLYRQKLQHHPDAKWLDLDALATLLIPTHAIKRIRYFTAMIRPALGTDPRAPIRQQTYVRALRTNPKVTIHEGQYRNDARMMPALPITFDDAGRITRVKVRKTEEKGSDVNLASYLVFDACRDDADLFVLVSNDSDFAAMLTLVTRELDKNWALLSPVDNPNHRLLALNPVFIKPIRRGALLASQLPSELHSAGIGALKRPEEWSANETGAPLGAPYPVAEASGGVISV